MKSKPSLRSFLLIAAASHLAISYAHAVNANWTGGGTDALWSNVDNWSASPVPETGNTATFNAAAGVGGTVIDLGAGVTVNTIVFAGSTVDAYTIGAGEVNSQSLTLNGGPGNAGLSGSSTGGTNTNQITINAAITVNNTQQWIFFNGKNPWIINGSVTPNGVAGSTIEVKNNQRSVIFNGLLADQVDGAKLRIGGANANTATLTNPNNTFTGGILFDNGSVSVNSIGLIGNPSAAGSGGDLLFGSGFGGGSLIYTGTNTTTDRVIKFNNGFHGPTITQSGTSGVLNFTADVAATSIGSQTLTLNGAGLGTGEISGKIVDNGTAGTTQVKTGGNNVATLQLNSVDGITVGSAISGTGIADGTTVTLINAGTRTITLSANTTANVAQNANITVAGVVNITHFTKNGSGTWALSGANTHSGFTRISAGTLTLSNSLALQNSPIDMVGSINGTASAGLKTTVTTLTLGGFNGTASPKNLASIFTITSGGYDGVTALTLNPRSGASFSYSGVIADGAAGMTLIKTGAGTQILGGSNTYTGPTAINEGRLVITGATQTTSAITFGGGVLGLDIATPVTAASATVNFTGQSVLVTGTPTNESYTLLTASSITGTPTLAAPAPAGYATQVVDNELRLVQTAGDTFATWIAGFGLAPEDQGFNFDADGDGIGNGVEAWFGTNPSIGGSGLTQVAKVGNTVTFTHPEANPALSDVTGSYQWSLDLATWNASAATEGGTTVTFTPAPNNPNPGTTTVTATITGSEPSKVFVRAVANQP